MPGAMQNGTATAPVDVALHQTRMEKQGASGQTDTKFEMQDDNSHAASLELQTFPTFFSLKSCVLIV